MALAGGLGADQAARSHIDKYHTQHQQMNNNFITDMNQSFVLQGPGPSAQAKPSSQTSKQAALKKKHFHF